MSAAYSSSSSWNVQQVASPFQCLLTQTKLNDYIDHDQMMIATMPLPVHMQFDNFACLDDIAHYDHNHNQLLADQVPNAVITKNVHIHEKQRRQRKGKNDGTNGVELHRKLVQEDDAMMAVGNGRGECVYVRAKRGEATDSHSLAERERRQKISEKMKLLQSIVPGCDKIVGKTLVLDEIINYIHSMQTQVEFLMEKLTYLDPTFSVNHEAVSSTATPEQIPYNAATCCECSAMLYESESMLRGICYGCQASSSSWHHSLLEGHEYTI